MTCIFLFRKYDSMTQIVLDVLKSLKMFRPYVMLVMISLQCSWCTRDPVWQSLFHYRKALRFQTLYMYVGLSWPSLPHFSVAALFQKVQKSRCVWPSQLHECCCSVPEVIVEALSSHHLVTRMLLFCSRGCSRGPVQPSQRHQSAAVLFQSVQQRPCLAITASLECCCSVPEVIVEALSSHHLVTRVLLFCSRGCSRGPVWPSQCHQTVAVLFQRVQ